MASIQINRGNSQEINNTPITDGLILFNTTNKTIYMDNENTRDVYSGQLSNSSDVEIVNLSDGQIIIWDETNNKWKNTDRYFEINNLTDVNLNSLVNGQILKYDETSGEWINTDYAINDLSNVNINLSTLADGQIIVYNATTDEWENSEVKGGHKILNDSGSTLTQKDNLQFKGVYTQNNGDNTEVDICRTMTKAQMEALSGEALKGFINTSDEPDSLPLTAEWVAYGNGSVKDGLDSKVSKTGDTITGNLFIQKSSGDSNIVLGGNSSRGVSRYYDETGHFVDVYPNTIATNRAITLPDKNGTIALTSDIPTVSLGGTLGTDVLQFAKDMPNNSIAFFYNSNNPANQPSGCSWGSYLFIKYNNATSALYWDNYHFAHTYNIVSTATSINWHVV